VKGQLHVVTERQARCINALMLTCGTHHAAGGIVAVVPDQLTLCVWSPARDATGNSLLGLKALELFVGKTGLSIFKEDARELAQLVFGHSGGAGLRDGSLVLQPLDVLVHSLASDAELFCC